MSGIAIAYLHAKVDLATGKILDYAIHSEQWPTTIGDDYTYYVVMQAAANEYAVARRFITLSLQGAAQTGGARAAHARRILHALARTEFLLP